MLTDKMVKQMLVVMPILGAIMLVCIILLACQIVPSSIECFAVDSNDRLYVGVPGKILVFEEDVQVATINPQTSRTYMFTILEDDRILLSTASIVYSMDLEGNVLQSWTEKASITYNDLKNERRRFESRSGDIYQLKSFLSWPRIVKNGDQEVYRLPAISIATTSTMAACCIFLVLFVFYILSQVPPKQDESLRV